MHLVHCESCGTMQCLVRPILNKISGVLDSLVFPCFVPGSLICQPSSSSSSLLRVPPLTYRGTTIRRKN